MKEIWKDVPGYEGKYQISNKGRIKNVKLNKISIGAPCREYLRSSIGFIHRLVGIAFIPNPENKPEIDHIDYNPHNNNVENLRWVTRAENAKHSGEHIGRANSGENHYRTKLTNQDVLDIINMRKEKKRYKLISSIYGVKTNTLCGIVTREKSWHYIKNSKT